MSFLNFQAKDVNVYYPYGTRFSDVFATTTDRYQYSGKEFDRMNGLDLYDFHARQYDPVLGRFTTPDPLSEKYYHLSPYAYCANNPLRYIDPTGLIPNSYEGALIADHIYEGNEGDCIGDWILENVYTYKDCPGFKAGLYVKYDSNRNPIEYVLANAGTDTKTFKGFFIDMVENIRQPFGESRDMKISINLAKSLIKEYSNTELTFVGHSKGAAEAAGNALATNKNALLYNPAAINSNSYGLNSSNYKGINGHGITAYIVSGDILDVTINKIATPIDKVVYLPKQSESPFINHSIKSVLNAILEYNNK